MKVILASSSKVRQDIFDMIGIEYEVITSLVEEESTATNPEEYVKEISKKKAESVVSQIDYNAIIIAVDEVIYMDGKIYEKPKTKEEAYNNIKEMIGKTTYAITGITIKDLYQDKEIVFSDVCEVTLKKNISDEDIQWYVDNEESILNRCGYAILGKAAIFVEKINGDYNTVIGISPSRLHDKIKELGYELSDFNIRKNR